MLGSACLSVCLVWVWVWVWVWVLVLVLSCPVLSCPVLSCPVLSCPVLFCLSVCLSVFLSVEASACLSSSICYTCDCCPIQYIGNFPQIPVTFTKEDSRENAVHTHTYIIIYIYIICHMSIISCFHIVLKTKFLRFRFRRVWP